MQKHETEPEKKRWQMSNKNAETVQLKQGDEKKKRVNCDQNKGKKKKKYKQVISDSVQKLYSFTGSINRVWPRSSAAEWCGNHTSRFMRLVRLWSYHKS